MLGLQIFYATSKQGLMSCNIVVVPYDLLSVSLQKLTN